MWQTVERRNRVFDTIDHTEDVVLIGYEVCDSNGSTIDISTAGTVFNLQREYGIGGRCVVKPKNHR